MENELFDKATELHRQGRWGEALNAYSQVVELCEQCLHQENPPHSHTYYRELIDKSLVSIALIQEIRNFVNVDLMNP